MNFDQAFAKVVDNEGGFTDDPRDRGNWTTGICGKGECKGTKYGISAMSFPTLDIRNLTLDDAKKIYHDCYWFDAGCDRVPEILRFHLFDAAVNHGVNNAVKILQRAAKIKADGIFGKGTELSVLTTTPEALVSRYNAHRLLFFTSIHTFNINGSGWVNRVAHNLMTLAEELH